MYSIETSPLGTQENTVWNGINSAAWNGIRQVTAILGKGEFLII